jgi:hypothetical protein
MKLYWGPGTQVRVIRDWRRPENFITTITRAEQLGVYVHPKPPHCTAWYTWNELEAVDQGYADVVKTRKAPRLLRVSIDQLIAGEEYLVHSDRDEWVVGWCTISDGLNPYDGSFGIWFHGNRNLHIADVDDIYRIES